MPPGERAPPFLPLYLLIRAIRVSVQALSYLTVAHPPNLSFATAFTNPNLRVCLFRKVSEQCHQSPRASLVLTRTAIDLIDLVHEDALAPLTCLSVERAVDVESQPVSSFFQGQIEFHDRLLITPPPRLCRRES